MSQPATRSMRPRRASRVPAKHGDENAAGATSAPMQRLISKASTTSLAKHNASGSAGALGTKSDNTAAAPARRALGDVSNRTNAGQGAASGAQEGKPALKPTRSRQASQAAVPVQHASVPQPPSSTAGAGSSFGRLALREKNGAQQLAKQDSAAVVGLGIDNMDVEMSKSTAATSSKPVNEDVEVKDAKADDVAHVDLSEDDEGAQSEGEQTGMVRRSKKRARAPTEDGGAMSIRIRKGAADGGQDGAEGETDEEEEDEDEADESKWAMSADADDMEAAERLRIRQEFDDPLDFWDPSMVAEYSDEIFAYMHDLELQSMPNPRYMEHQTEIDWSMRSTLVDWLLQVHMRYHMLPETLWIAVNIVDRFLSNRVVSRSKLQLVGVTAMFVAAKYEEIMAPSVDEFVYMCESGYTKDEILKGERIILTSLEFAISSYCTPYSWVRRISKADDYDLQTRTLSKFLMEVTLQDHRFLRAKPSLVAAVGMFLSRKMLGNDWNDAFIFYSDYCESQLVAPTQYILEIISAPGFDSQFVYKKYSSKKFLKASIFARNWAKSHQQAISSQEDAF